ncbi:MAG: dihydroorotate dehydrogenase electron transfer subunit [Candidatus Gastranaerophilaceae bacterium]|jgi:dihydroorotate dehydrogenase electron transfer subunit
MKKQGIFTIEKNVPVARDTYSMRLIGDTSAISAPGQFVNILVDGLYLRRPISVCDVEGDGLTIVYKEVGEGTRAMAAMKAGGKLDLLTGLGNGFTVVEGVENPLVIGGGVGTPPMYLLAKRLLQAGQKPAVALGFNSRADAMLCESFEDLGIAPMIATLDGSLGIKGFVTDLMRVSGTKYDGDASENRTYPNTDLMRVSGTKYGYYYACGPAPMLRAVWEALGADGQLSFEERMGCGFGACMGCSIKTKGGYKRVCADGPVLFGSEIIWD